MLQDEEEECHKSPSSWRTWCSVSNRKISWSHLLNMSVWLLRLVLLRNLVNRPSLHEKHETRWLHSVFIMVLQQSGHFYWANSAVQRMKSHRSNTCTTNGVAHHNECRNDHSEISENKIQGL